MRVLMVEPSVYDGETLVKRSARPTQLVSLTLPHLAALVPGNVDVTIAYEMTEDLERGRDLASYDLIALTTQTIQVNRTLELLRSWRGLGPKLVVGGPATVEDDRRLVRVLARFADAVAIADGELVWPQILADARTGSLRKTYQSSSPPPIAGLPLPRFELVDFDRIQPPHVLPALTAWGCPRRCRFCSEFLYGPWRLRPVDDVVKELLRYRDRFGIPRVCFRDDDLLVDHRRSTELLSRLVGEGIEWACQTDLGLTRHPDLVQLAVAAGMRSVSFGLESVRDTNRRSARKTFFTVPQTEDLLLNLHEAGVETQLNIIFGFDGDDQDVFDETFDLLVRTKVSRFFPSILYPIPGTALHQQLNDEGRLLADRAPGIRDPLLVWFKPKHLSAEDLVQGYLGVQRRFENLPDNGRNYWLGRDVVII